MSLTEQTPSFETLRNLFAEQDLEFPNIPEQFHSELKPVSEFVYATRDIQFGPYAINAFVGEIRGAGQVDDYALIGFDGHGTNSWAVHYFLVEEPIALFVQLEWGGAYTEEEIAKTVIKQTFEKVSALRNALHKLNSDGKIPPRTRLVIKLSDLEDSGWGWVSDGHTQPDWHDDGDVFEQIIGELQSL